jgi:hypothetical protein
MYAEGETATSPTDALSMIVSFNGRSALQGCIRRASQPDASAGQGEFVSFLRDNCSFG